MKTLRTKYIRLLNSVKMDFSRSLIRNINFSERLIIIKGQRGTGKTTLMLQHIKMNFTDLSETLYISLDDIYFSNDKLSDVVEEFTKDGGRYLFVDEVHKYNNWSQEIKNIYDFYPDLKIMLTGSLAIDFHINSSDLGRRAAVYSLPELSFREYLSYGHGQEFPILKLEDILEKHESIAMNINSRIKPLKYFKTYLKTGAYPFATENEGLYFEKIEAVINTIIDNDIPAVENIIYESQVKLKKLLLMIASSSPFKINMSELSRNLNTTRDVLTKYINLLSKAGIIKTLTTSGIGKTIIRKPEKIYFSNSNIIYALNENVDIGTIRETFFLNQISALYKASYPKQGDFKIENNLLFEIGGKNKTNKQIAGIKDSFLALDEIEFGHKNRIPLWMFGFLY